MMASQLLSVQPNELEQISCQELPSMLQDIVHLIGMENTYRLLSQYGGQIKYVTKHPSKCIFRSCVAEQELTCFCHELGGLTIEVPKLDHLEKRVRKIRIDQGLQRGVSVSEVARRYQLCVRHVRNTKKLAS